MYRAANTRKSNSHARPYLSFEPWMARPITYRIDKTSRGTSLGACGTLGMSPRLIPPHSVKKPYTNLPPLKYCYNGLHVNQDKKSSTTKYTIT